MSSINFATREISCKLVYYGPGLSGKTTNLQVIHQKIPREKKTEMVSLATEGDRTLFFDFLPLNLGNIKGFKTKFQLYTVPGQVYYNSTRKLVLRGVDGVVFVADSQKNRHAENLDSLQNLRQNLAEYGLNLDELPYVLQYNKRDMPDVYTLDEMNEILNPNQIPWFPATAHNGKGVIATLKAASRLVIENFNLKQGMLRKAATQAEKQGGGVHDVTLGKNDVNVAPVAPVPPKDTAKPTEFAPSFEAPIFEAPEAPEVHSGKSSFEAPPAPAASESMFQAPPSSDSMSFMAPPPEGEDEEIELRPYVPKSKDN